jgi:hypothetical protein
MTKAEALELTIQRCNAAVEHQLELVEIDLLDQGAPPEHVEDELAAVRVLFEEHRDQEIAKVKRWLSNTDSTLH